ncbi:ion channel [Luteipulveratus flavus]|uniref:Ion channel n=1 Tax=Luteipulveratus flavus TaxID=3031728 RepID=A0ABT6C8U4_9MICO|nr:ion channel [Luteipulveratus sp. YIM 133296]MDF8265310.1 ion channel [Luteipulveratus sp. YIM 133296]
MSVSGSTRITAPSWWRRLADLPCAVLLAVQLLGIVVYPFTESDLGRAAFSLFQLLVLFVAVAAVRMTPALNRISVLLGVPSAVLTLVEVFMPDDDVVALLSGVTHAAFYFYLAYALLRYMFADEHVTTDELYATGACFTVVAWAFAYVYAVVQVVWGSGQFLAAKHTGDLSWMEMLFLSFTTMTGTGLSDISPVGSHSRSVVMLEQLAGVYYLALVVARLLGLTLARFRPR